MDSKTVLQQVSTTIGRVRKAAEDPAALIKQLTTLSESITLATAAVKDTGTAPDGFAAAVTGWQAELIKVAGAYPRGDLQAEVEEGTEEIELKADEFAKYAVHELSDATTTKDAGEMLVRLAALQHQIQEAEKAFATKDDNVFKLRARAETVKNAKANDVDALAASSLIAKSERRVDAGAVWPLDMNSKFGRGQRESW